MPGFATGPVIVQFRTEDMKMYFIRLKKTSGAYAIINAAAIATVETDQNDETTIYTLDGKQISIVLSIEDLWKLLPDQPNSD